MVTLFQQKKNIVAMTGDGFNDALALKKADIDVAGHHRLLGLTSLSRSQWLICLASAIALLLVDEIIKAFPRSRRSYDTSTPAAASPDISGNI